MISDNETLRNQTILVTGASRGIGAAIAVAIAAKGARVIVHYGQNKDAAELVFDRIGRKGWLLQADLSEREGATKLWEAAEKVAGRIDALVNNAGIRLTTRVEDDLTGWQDTWRRELQVNLLSPADLCRAAIVHFRRNGGGKIINISTRAGQRGHQPEFMPYGASKAGLLNLTKSIARGFAHENIIAVAIAPGFVRTAMAEEYLERFGKDATVGDIPLKEMAEPAEVAELVAFVLQPSQRSLNGATLDINGASYVR